MGQMEEVIESVGIEAAGVLKKVAASRGKLQGNFYYAGDPSGNPAGLAVTLTARDPKGAKVVSTGKGLRKAIPGAKFGRGTVIVDGAKLLFDLQSGSISGGQMKTGFKKGFGSDALKMLHSLLRKAIIRSPDLEEEETSSSAASSTTADAGNDESEDLDFDTLLSDMEMSPNERADFLQELKDLEAEQGDLAERNKVLQASFLSARELEIERAEQITALQGDLVQLLRTNPRDAAAIQQKAAELARTAPTGTALPTQGAVPEDYALLLTSSRQTLLDMVPVASRAWQEAVEVYRAAIGTADAQLAALRSVLVASDDPDLVWIGEKGLPSIFSGQRDALEQALSNEARTDPDAQPAARLVIAGLADTFAASLAASDAVAVTDYNPYGVAVTLQAGLGTALRGLSLSARQ